MFVPRFQGIPEMLYSPTPMERRDKLSCKGVGAETTDFGPISDFVMLLFTICAMILVSKNPNFMKVC